MTLSSSARTATPLRSFALLGSVLLGGAACQSPETDVEVPEAASAEVSDRDDARHDAGASLAVSADMPLTVRTVEVRGEVSLHTVGASCLGATSASPTLSLVASEPVALNLEVSAEVPLSEWSVTVCQQGTCRCDVAQRRPVARLHEVIGPEGAEVYVGARDPQGQQVALALWPGPPSESPGVLTLGEGLLPPIREDGTPAVPTDAGTFGGVQLAAETAPAVLHGTAGGTRDATEMGHRCRGQIAEAPDHVVTLASPSELVWRVDAAIDTTLVLVGPDGAWWCSDDVNGLNPALQGHYDAGTYHVYIGTLGPTPEAPPYTLTVSR